MRLNRDFIGTLIFVWMGMFNKNPVVKLMIMPVNHRIFQGKRRVRFRKGVAKKTRLLWEKLGSKKKDLTSLDESR